MSSISASLIAEVERQLAELEAADRVTEQAPTRRPRRGRGSPVLSIRLDAEELAALERRAAAVGIPPSVLARNFIGIGLRVPRRDDDLRAAVERLDSAMEGLRATLR